MYAEMVRTHWQKYRPKAWAMMGPAEQDAFARDLSDQIESQIEALAEDYEGQPKPGETFLQKVGRLNMAKLRAREQVLSELLPPAEADEVPAPDVPVAV